MTCTFAFITMVLLTCIVYFVITVPVFFYFLTENYTPRSLLMANSELEVLRSTVNDLSVELQILEEKYEKGKCYINN